MKKNARTTIRLSTADKELMQRAIEKWSFNISSISEAEFMRLAVRAYSQQILAGDSMSVSINKK